MQICPNYIEFSIVFYVIYRSFLFGRNVLTEILFSGSISFILTFPHTLKETKKEKMPQKIDLVL